MAAQTFGKRRIGRTALEITELGLGSASLAGNMTPVSDLDARAVVPHALELGITFFDTAPFYGYGRAERIVGDGLRSHRQDVVLSTKVGRLLDPFFGSRPAADSWRDALPFVDRFDYSYDAIMRSYEDSLQRLGLNRIDVLLVHDIGVMTHGAERNAVLWKQLEAGGYRALDELRRNGHISAIGLGVNEWQVLMDAFTIGDWDVFLLAGRYTLLEQTSLSPFLATCTERGASVIVGGPFNSGVLVGGSTWNYDKAPPEVVDRVRRLTAICDDFAVPLPAAALRFPLGHEAICTVLPGPRSPAELDEIVGWWNTEIPDELWVALAEQKLVAPGTPMPNGSVAAPV